MLDLSELGGRLLGPARDVGVEICKDLHGYDGRQEFHRPFVEAATHVFLNADSGPGIVTVRLGLNWTATQR